MQELSSATPHASAHATQLASRWLTEFDAALVGNSAMSLRELLLETGHWRDIAALTWSIGTTSGTDAVAQQLADSAVQVNAHKFRLDQRRSAPQWIERAGEMCLEFFCQFETKAAECIAVVRLQQPAAGTTSVEGQRALPADLESSASATVDSSLKAWTIMTALERLRGEQADTVVAPETLTDLDAPNWLDLRNTISAYEGRDPQVLIVGGGHAGCTSAAELGQLGIDALVIDREQRIGDNWRLRYHSLKLHNRTPINHFPHMRFPDTFPDYIPKDKLANWIESYVDAMEINFWTETSFEHAAYDQQNHCWDVRVRRADGSVRGLRPQHIIMATSVSGTPKRAQIPTLERFAGRVLHSSEFANGENWSGRKTAVFGTGTSAHDVAQNLQANCAEVTMVQRSPTMILNIEPSAQLYDGVYLGDGPVLEERDLLNSSFPIALVKQAHQIVTRKVREIDAELLAGLERAGFKLEFGEDDSGWPLKYRTRGGGYYFNAGCSDLIVSGDIKLAQYADIESFTPTGLRLRSGADIDLDLVVLATGYQGQDYLVRQYFGDTVADRIGPVWGMDPHSKELCNMWSPTPQPGLWFTAGSLSQCRIYSKYLAMQIKARLRGLSD